MFCIPESVGSLTAVEAQQSLLLVPILGPLYAGLKFRPCPLLEGCGCVPQQCKLWPKVSGRGADCALHAGASIC